jgi:hypothetical protein
VVRVGNKVIFLRGCAAWKAQQSGQTRHQTERSKTSAKQGDLFRTSSSILKMKLNFNFKIMN